MSDEDREDELVRLKADARGVELSNLLLQSRAYD